MKFIFRPGFISDLASGTRQRANTCQADNFNLFHSSFLQALGRYASIVFIFTLLLNKLFFMKVKNEEIGDKDILCMQFEYLTSELTEQW